MASMMSRPVLPVISLMTCWELHVHLGQRLLHMLDMVGGVLHQHDPLPQAAAQAPDLPVGPESSRQQAVGVQLLQPLAVQHVGLAAGHILDAPGVHQHHLEAPLLQHPEQRYPVHAGGLRDHGLHTTLAQPVRQTVQVRRESLKLPHRWLLSVGGHRHIVAGGAHIDARRVQVQLGQSCRFCPAPASAHHRLCHCRVGVSPEGAADCSHSPQRDRPDRGCPDRGCTNDAVVRLPGHATGRAIRTRVCSVFVRTTRLAMSIHPWADSPVSRLCTGRTRA